MQSVVSATGILFDDVEPPDPYAKRSWITLPFKAKEENFGLRAHQVEHWSQPHRGQRVPAPFPSQTHLPPQQPFIPPQRQALLPSSSTTVTVQIIQDIARANITQLFNNDTPIIIRSGKYQFPLPFGSSVVAFKCRIGEDRVLDGQVKPRSTARAEFDHAVHDGRTAGLVEQNTSEIFTTQIGNIPANTQVTAELSFIFFLKHNFSQGSSTTTLTIPTYIAPRYGSPDFEPSDLIPAPDQALAISLEILNGDKIAKIESDTHNVTVTRVAGEQSFQRWADFIDRDTTTQSSCCANVKLSTGYTCLDKDFVLRIFTQPPEGTESPRASLETHPLIEGHSALMVEIPPGFMLQSQTPVHDREVIFLADQSGSMHDKNTGLISSVQFFLRSLPLSIHFNICCFGSTYKLLWPRSKMYDDATLNEAISYVSLFSHDMGGTDLLPALEYVVQQQRHRYLDIVVLTDGEVWRLTETIEFVKSTRKSSESSVRFFTLGIGNAVSHALIEGIASAGGGYAEVIPAARTNGWEDRVVAVLKAALTGHAGPLSIEVKDLNIQYGGSDDFISRPTVQMSPPDISTLSPFLWNRVFILAENSQLSAHSVINIKTRDFRGQENATALPVTALHNRDSLLHKFAARSLISDLEIGNSWIQRDNRIMGNSSLWTRKEGERLGCQWSLVSKWTSFVAIETAPSSPLEQPSSSSTVVPSIKQVDGDDLGLLRPRGRMREVLQKLSGSIPPIHQNNDMSDHAIPNAPKMENCDHQGCIVDVRSRGAHGLQPISAHGTSMGYEHSSMLDSTGLPEFIHLGCSDSSGEDGEECWGLSTLGPGGTEMANETCVDGPDGEDTLVLRSLSPPSIDLSQLRNSPPVSSQPQSLQAYPPPSVDMAQGADPPVRNSLKSRFTFKLFRKSRSQIPYAEASSTPHFDRDLSPAKDDEDVAAGEAFVRRIVSFQRADGCFKFPSLRTAKKHLGPELFVIIDRWIKKKKIDADVAVTMAIVLLLEERFHSCKGLWLLIVSKAKSNIRSHGGALSREVRYLQDGSAARRDIREIKKLPLEEEDDDDGEEEKEEEEEKEKRMKRRRRRRRRRRRE
ncbi:hypothetical protein FQN49_000473 [Arthroderma sp. PD_2]|nr:hypothetical protein FQN49_000473 [Arthroderma sp. PD_2]